MISQSIKYFKQTTAMVATLTLSHLFLWNPLVLAETTTRVNSRCKLTIQRATVFDGHCVFKHKERQGRQVFSVDLDNGSSYKFAGPSVDSLQVEDYAGLHNVQFAENDAGDKDVFNWTSNGASNRLVVKLDTQVPANVSTNPSSSSSSSKPSVEAVVGAGIGALIGALISGGKSTPAPSSNTVVVGQTVPDLSDLVGAKGGQAENTLRQRGYVFIKATQQADSAYSNWKQTKTGNCVAIRTTDGRYAAIVYAPKSDCNQ